MAIASSLRVLVLAAASARLLFAAPPSDGASGGAATADDLHLRYGFSGFIISKLSDGISNLGAADVDGDGRSDLVVVNNATAKIEFLLQQRPGESATSEVRKDRVNELPDESYFRRDAYPTEEKVTSVAVADVDGDGRNDLLFVGDSNKLTIAYRDAEGRYPRTARFDIEGCSQTSEALRVADLNNDGRMDVAVLGRELTHLLVQDSAGHFGEPKKLPNATKDAAGFDVRDLDGDAVADLLYVAPGNEWPFRYRRGEPGLAFGPEIASRFADVRSYAVGNYAGDARAEIVALRRRSGRVALLAFDQQAAGAAEALPLSALRSVPYGPLKDADKREEVFADLDGDGRPELLVTEPSAARVLVHRGLLGGGTAADSFESFIGVSRPRLADVDGDGRKDLVTAAPAEGAIGVSTLDATGKVGFPRALAIPGGATLLALDAADTDGDGKAEIWVVLGSGDGKKRERKLIALAQDGKTVSETALADLKSDPNDLLIVDLDRNGHSDALIFVPKEVPKILIAGADRAFTDIKAEGIPNLGILKDVARTALAYGDVDGDGKAELLVPGANFARAMVLGADHTVETVRQFGLDRPSAEITAVGIGDLDGSGLPEILMVDKSISSLVVLRQDGDARQQIGKVDLGGLSPRGIAIADLDQNGTRDVLIAATDRFAVIQNGGNDALFRERADLEIPLKDGFIDGVAVGDVNGDGQADAVATETNEHQVAIAAVRADHLDYALSFAVFEERIFERGGKGGREPREVIVCDATGDGRLDIAIIVHDRVIVYPQE